MSYPIQRIPSNLEYVVVDFEEVIHAIRAFNQAGRNPFGAIQENPGHCPVLYAFSVPSLNENDKERWYSEAHFRCEFPGMLADCKKWGIGDFTWARVMFGCGYVTDWKFLYISTRSFRVMPESGAHRVYQVEMTPKPVVREVRLLLRKDQDDAYYGGSYFRDGFKSAIQWEIAMDDHRAPSMIKLEGKTSWLLGPEAIKQMKIERDKSLSRTASPFAASSH